MSWAIKDEWIDLEQGRHYVIFHNPDIKVVPASGVGTHVPKEHHLVHSFQLPACPHCGKVNAEDVQDTAQTIDFEKHKEDTLAALNAHHKAVMDYKAKHPRVRLGRGPR